MADLWQDYFVKRRFQALEITQVPMPITDPEYWHWGPLSQAHYEKEYLVGNFLVREYLLDRDEFAYKVVRRENFLKYYLKEEPNAQQIPCPETNDGSARSRVESPRGQEESSQSDSGGRGEGVQRGGRAEGQAQEVAVAYATVCDGWIEIPARAIRNPESPNIVWMLRATWQRLATHATDRGLFFIPCEVARTPEALRIAVNHLEIADAS